MLLLLLLLLLLHSLHLHPCLSICLCLCLLQVVRDMTQRDPEKRTSVRNYRHILEGRRDPSTLIARDSSTSAVATAGETTPPYVYDKSPQDVFPDYFSRVVHPIFQMLHVKGVSPDDRIVILCEVNNPYAV